MAAKKQPEHVKAWNRALRLHPPSKQEATTNSLEYEWFAKQWRINAIGQTFTGKLDSIQEWPDVFFTIKMSDPADADRTLFIRAPFEQFSCVE